MSLLYQITARVPLPCQLMVPRGSLQELGGSAIHQVKMAYFGTRDFEEFQVMNIDEEIMRKNGNDSVSFNHRDKLSQVVLKNDRNLVFGLKTYYPYVGPQVQAEKIVARTLHYKN